MLAGGAGRRMGHLDKAALDVGGRTLLDRVLGAARPVCARLVVVGPRRRTGVDGVAFVAEAVPGGGPVPAVAAGLDLVPDAETIVVLAVDLPLLGSGDLDVLLDTLERSASDAVAASDHRGWPNPLLAAYRAPCLRGSLDRLGPDAAGGPAAALLPPRTATVDLGPLATLNVNCPADLDRARALLEAAARPDQPEE